MAAIGVAGVSIAVILLLSRAKRPFLGQRDAEECAVSECGPDGTALSLYAG